MVVFDNLITVSVLLILGLIIYTKMTGKTLLEIVKGLREAFGSGEEVLEYE